jgi:hypothetical protein
VIYWNWFGGTSLVAASSTLLSGVEIWIVFTSVTFQAGIMCSLASATFQAGIKCSFRTDFLQHFFAFFYNLVSFDKFLIHTHLRFRPVTLIL